MAVKFCTEDAIELVNELPGVKPDDTPAVLLELGSWTTERGVSSGISVESFGSAPPILSANDARRLAKWLTKAAEALDGVQKAAHRRGQKKRREDEFEDDFE